VTIRVEIHHINGLRIVTDDRESTQDEYEGLLRILKNTSELKYLSCIVLGQEVIVPQNILNNSMITVVKLQV
jgi:hypothetical protein